MATLNYSTYERELKAILEGEPAALRRYRRTASSPTTLEALEALERHPFLVVRAAGSHGFDLVALRGSLSLPIEVKCSGSEVIRFASSRGRNQEQFETLLAQTRRAGLFLLYAYRLVGASDGDPWRLFSANMMSRGTASGSNPAEPPVIGAIAGFVSKRTPTVSATPQGNTILRWAEGRPLTDLLAQVVNFPS